MTKFNIPKLEFGTEINKDCGLTARNIRYQSHMNGELNPTVKISNFICSRCTGCTVEGVKDYTEDLGVGFIVGMTLGSAMHKIAEALLDRLIVDDICGTLKPE